jgi:hypothetical protein
MIVTIGIVTGGIVTIGAPPQSRRAAAIWQAGNQSPYRELLRASFVCKSGSMS